MSAPLDLPSLASKPSYQTLLDLLLSLEIKPATWTGGAPAKERDAGETTAINTWLPKIFRSDLAWFSDALNPDGSIVTADDQRDEIMDLAARRLAERCGRSATSDITRTWSVPSDLVPGSSEDLQIQIHEPGLTEGNTGHKTWGTAFALIKELSMYKEDHSFFKHLLYPGKNITTNEDGKECVVGPTRHILELGSGTGLLGIAAAAIWSCPVILTDREVIVPNLKRNAAHNLQTVHDRHGDLFVETISWSEHSDASHFTSDLCPRTFPIILASDTLYDDEQVDILANTIDNFLDNYTESRALVAVPLRDKFCEGLVTKFDTAMGERGFVVLNRGLVSARDDFGDAEEEVVIQRSLFGRREMKLEKS